MVDLQKRFAPAMQILKKKLQGSKGTKTYNLKFLTGAYPEGDALFDLFIHPIDCVVYLFGKAEIRCVEPIDEHTVMLVLKHADAIGVLELSTDYTWSDAKESMTINKQLEEKLDEHLSMAGIEVVEARINYLAYAPEIAAVMLRRQQADAIISAREKIVEGAVSMVKMALDKLSSEGIVQLNDDKKAAMVSNLLVVLCGDDAAQPVVNTGTLNH